MAARTRDRPALTREHIVRVALELIDAAGVDGLSMRRLGQALGVDPMAVYYHVPHKAALFDAIVEQLWSGVSMPAREVGETWEQVLHGVFTAFRGRLLEHPRAVVLVGTRPTVAPAMLRLVDAALGRLVACGLSAAEAMQLVDCLAGYTVGKVLGELGEADAAVAEVVGAALADVTPGTHPHLARAMAAGYAYTPDEQFDRGLRALLRGWPTIVTNP